MCRQAEDVDIDTGACLLVATGLRSDQQTTNDYEDSLLMPNPDQCLLHAVHELRVHELGVHPVGMHKPGVHGLGAHELKCTGLGYMGVLGYMGLGYMGVLGYMGLGCMSLGCMSLGCMLGAHELGCAGLGYMGVLGYMGLGCMSLGWAYLFADAETSVTSSETDAVDCWVGGQVVPNL